MSKKARSEGNRVATLIKANKAEYYVADVNLEDDSNDVYSAAISVRKTLGKFPSNFILISAGVKNLTVVVDLSPTSKITPKEWLEASLYSITETFTFDNEISGKVVVEMETPFKFKDIVRSNAFAYLRKMNLLEEEESEEEYFEM